MLDRRTGQIIADLTQQGFTLVAFRLVYANLDEFVGGEATVDFLAHRFGETLLADGDDGVERVGAGAQGSPLGGGQFDHDGIVSGEEAQDQQGLDA